MSASQWFSAGVMGAADAAAAASTSAAGAAAAGAAAASSRRRGAPSGLATRRRDRQFFASRRHAVELYGAPGRLAPGFADFSPAWYAVGHEVRDLLCVDDIRL